MIVHSIRALSLASAVLAGLVVYDAMTPQRVGTTGILADKKIVKGVPFVDIEPVGTTKLMRQAIPQRIHEGLVIGDGFRILRTPVFGNWKVAHVTRDSERIGTWRPPPVGRRRLAIPVAVFLLPLLSFALPRTMGKGWAIRAPLTAAWATFAVIELVAVWFWVRLVLYWSGLSPGF